MVLQYLPWGSSEHRIRFHAATTAAPAQPGPAGRAWACWPLLAVADARAGAVVAASWVQPAPAATTTVAAPRERSAAGSRLLCVPLVPEPLAVQPGRAQATLWGARNTAVGGVPVR